MKHKILILMLLMTGTGIGLNAQNPNRLARKGNKTYEAGKYNDAEVLYRKALEKKPEQFASRFNLGNSMYKQENYTEAAKAWASVTTRGDIESPVQSEVWHNIGNAMAKAKNYGQAIEAYKNALRLNPGDADTRYNLAWAMAQAQQQEEEQKQDQQEQKQDQQQQKQEQQQQPEQQEQPREANPREISKQDAERMLEAMKNAEQKTMEKLKKEQKAVVAGKREKDW